jgi:uncharacterized membrane protein
MNPNGKSSLDRRLACLIGALLRIGVLAAAAVVLAGGVLYLVHSGLSRPDYRSFRTAPAHARDLQEVLRNAWALNGEGLIQLGLLILIATPVMRVVFSAVVFAIERDILYVAATSIVLAVLLYSLFVQGMA